MDSHEFWIFISANFEDIEMKFFWLINSEMNEENISRWEFLSTDSYKNFVDPNGNETYFIHFKPF